MLQAWDGTATEPGTPKIHHENSFARQGAGSQEEQQQEEERREWGKLRKGHKGDDWMKPSRDAPESSLHPRSE